MSDSEQNKSEKPTPFKLEQARKKGSVARGMDLGFLTGLSAFLAYIWISGDALADRVSLTGREVLVMAPTILDTPGELFALSGHLLASVARPLAFMCATVFAVVLLFELLQTGVVFTLQPLKPDFSKLNPVNGFKRVFSVRMLVETAKNILKMAVYTGISWMVIRRALEIDLASVTDASSLATALSSASFRLLAAVIAAAAAFAVLDQFISRKEFLKKMRMSGREVRRELRDREGEPRMKQRRKQLHAEFVKASQSLRNIRGADVVITNPTHIAVALRYEAGRMSAPKVVARGSDAFALRLRRLAFLYGVTIVEDRRLARALFQQCVLEGAVPESCYRQVADVYLALPNRKKG